MGNKWLKGDWSAAGFLNFFAQLAWAGYLIVLIIYTGSYLAYLFGFLPGLAWDLSARINLGNLSQLYDMSNSGVSIFTNSSMNVHMHSLSDTLQNSWMYHIAVILKLGLYAAVLYGLTLVKRILESIIDDKPWQPKNTRRLNIIGYLMVLAVPYQWGIGWLSYFIARQTSLPEQISVLPPIPGFEIGLAGVVVGLVAFLFKQGTQMHDEQQLTV